MPLFLIIALFLGGTATIASEQALPGDILYPVKVNVNESLRGALSFSAEADGEWNIEQAERRIKEAIELAGQNELNAEARTEIEQRFLEHSARVEARIKELQQTDPEKAAELAEKFEASLDAHARILGNLNATTTSNSASTIATLIRREGVSTSSLRAQNEATITAQTSVDVAARGKVTAATNKIAEVQKSLERARAKYGVSATADAEARLSVAASNLAGAKASLDAHNYTNAFARASEAHRTAQEAQLLIDTGLSLGITAQGTGTASTGTTTSASSNTNVNIGTGVKVRIGE